MSARFAPRNLTLHPPPERFTCQRRRIFNFPNLSPFSSVQGDDPKLQTYHERKVLPYARKQLYEIVADVASYPRFVPFCTGARILTPQTSQGGSSSVKHLEAELTVGFLSLTESYVSKVVCTPYDSVEATAASSSPLFKTLITTWRFQDITPQSPQPEWTALHPPGAASLDERSPQALVVLDLAYAFANPVHASASAMFFGSVSRLMVEAFQKRCIEVYGHGPK